MKRITKGQKRKRETQHCITAHLSHLSKRRIGVTPYRAFLFDCEIRIVVEFVWGNASERSWKLEHLQYHHHLLLLLWDAKASFHAITSHQSRLLASLLFVSSSQDSKSLSASARPFWSERDASWDNSTVAACHLDLGLDGFPSRHQLPPPLSNAKVNSQTWESPWHLPDKRQARSGTKAMSKRIEPSSRVVEMALGIAWNRAQWFSRGLGLRPWNGHYFLGDPEYGRGRCRDLTPPNTIHSRNTRNAAR